MDVKRVSENRTQEVASKKTEQAAGARKASKADKAAAKNLFNEAPVKSQEHVSLSADAALLSEGVELARNAPDVRSDRVKQLKDSIKAGTYKVDAKAIAERMLKEGIEETANAQES